MVALAAIASKRIPSKRATRWDVIVPPNFAGLGSIVPVHKCRALRNDSETRLHVQRESGRSLETLIFGMSGDGQWWRRAGRARVAEIDNAIARVHLLEQSRRWLANAAADGRAGLGSLGNGYRPATVVIAAVGGSEFKAVSSVIV